MNSKQIFNIPNSLSIIRIIIIPFFILCFLNNQLTAAAVLLVISGLSDSVDGFFARKFNQITNLGKILDPLADKMTLAAVVVCMWIKYGEKVKGLPVLFSILILKELLLGAGGLIFFKKINAAVGSMWYGKATTFVFYVVMTLLVLVDVLKIEFSGKEHLYFYSILFVVLLTVFSFIKYCLYAFKLYNKSKTEKLSAVKCAETAVKQ